MLEFMLVLASFASLLTGITWSVIEEIRREDDQ